MRSETVLPEAAAALHDDMAESLLIYRGMDPAVVAPIKDALLNEIDRANISSTIDAVGAVDTMFEFASRFPEEEQEVVVQVIKGMVADWVNCLLQRDAKH